MKQMSHAWARTPVLLLIVASAVVLLTVTALAKSPAAVRSDVAVAPAAPTVPTVIPPGSAIYIGTSHSGSLEIDSNSQVAAAAVSDTKLKFKAYDMLKCTIGANGKCTWTVVSGAAMGISSVNLRDFEILPSGAVIFAIDRTTTKLAGLGKVTPRDILCYTPGVGLNLAMKGADLGLTKSSETIDAVAITADNHVVFSTAGSAKINGIDVDVRDRDLSKTDGVLDTTTCTVGGTTASRYFDGTKTGLTSSSEDVSAAWIANPSSNNPSNIYLVTKGSFSTKNSNVVKGKKSDIFGCSPLNTNPITSCFFYEFFKGKPNDLDKQIDGISILATEPVASAVAAEAMNDFATSTVETDDVAFDTEGYNAAISDNNPDISAEDFIDVQTQVFLPRVTSR